MDHRGEMTNERRDPVCGMTGVIERRGHWFCSQGCVKEFERRSAAGVPKFHRWRDPWVWVPASGLLIATAWMWYPPATAISAIYIDYVRKIAGPLLLGLAIGGLVDYAVPKSYIVSLLAAPRKRVVALAAVLGVLASSCSHGCLALSIELYRKGASTAAALSFLLASPWANLALTLLLISLFGARGLVVVLAALVVALLTGLVFQRLESTGRIPPNPHAAAVEPVDSIRQDALRRLRAHAWTREQLGRDARGIWQGMIPLGRMMVGWVQLGIVLSALVGALVPHAVFTRWLGPTPLGLLATMGVATVMEVCSEGTAPVAFELYRHTGALGNAFAFLVAGVVTDLTELGAIWTTMGRRVVGWLLLVALPMVLALGLLLNLW